MGVVVSGRCLYNVIKHIVGVAVGVAVVRVLIVTLRVVVRHCDLLWIGK